MSAKQQRAGRRLRVPSPAMIVACIALAVALSGASYAAVVLPRNSVGTPQLKRSAVTSAKVKDNALTGADIDEARLAPVPSAANADMLDGYNSLDFMFRLSAFASYYLDFGHPADSSFAWMADTPGGELEVFCGPSGAAVYYHNTSTATQMVWSDVGGGIDPRYNDLPPGERVNWASLNVPEPVARHYTFIVRKAAPGPRYVHAEAMLTRRNDGYCFGEAEVSYVPPPTG